MCDTDTRSRKPAPAILEKLAIYEHVLSASSWRPEGRIVAPAAVVPIPPMGADVDMVQEPEAGTGGASLIAPRRIANPCLESPQRMDLHRELLFNQKIGKNVLNQKSELQKALSKHKEKQMMNQEKEHKETPELERAIAERARRLEASQPNAPPPDPATNPHLQEIRARLRHATPART